MDLTAFQENDNVHITYSGEFKPAKVLPHLPQDVKKNVSFCCEPDLSNMQAVTRQEWPMVLISVSSLNVLSFRRHLLVQFSSYLILDTCVFYYMYS